MLQIKNTLGGGGATKVLNGVLGEYYAKDTDIEPCSFINFESDIGESAGTFGQVNSIKNSGQTVCTVALDDTRVLLAHSYSSSGPIYAMVCTVIDGVTTYGTDTLVSSDGSNLTFKLIKESDNVVTLLTVYYKTLYYVRLTLDGTTITSENKGSISLAYDCPYGFNAIKIEEGKYLIAQVNGDNLFMSSVLSITSSFSMSITSPTIITSLGSYSPYGIDISYIEQNKFLFVYEYNRNLYGLVLVLEGDTITYGAETLLDSSSTYTTDGMSSVYLNNKAYITHTKKTATNYYTLGLIICMVSGTVITKEGDVQITSTKYSDYNYSIGPCKLLALGHNNLVCIYKHGNADKCYATLVQTKDLSYKNIELGSFVKGSSYSSTNQDGAVIGNSIFFASSTNSNNYYLFCASLSATIDRLISSVHDIDGLLVSKATQTQKGRVYSLQ